MLKCICDTKYCRYCNRYTSFYKYINGASGQWICSVCSNSWCGGGGYR